MLALLWVATFAAAPAHAQVAAVFGGRVPCVVDADGFRVCQGDASHLVPSWDGTPIDVNVVLPPAPAGAPDGGYPLIATFHGWGGAKAATAALKGIAKRGYAAFSMSDRGWGGSCSGQTTSLTDAACAAGYNHLMDLRYEVRDAQTLIGDLADDRSGDGSRLVDGQRVGVQGGSYGGGMSVDLAVLKDRVMMPDGTLVPWRSAAGQPMRIAAATPNAAWTDLAYALFPTGRELDSDVDAAYGPRVGVFKASFSAGLWAGGLRSSNYFPPTAADQVDFWTFMARAAAGGPYDEDPVVQSMLAELRSHHSAYYVDPSEAPAPILIANGWADDLFPVDEALRLYNRTRFLHPEAPFSMFLWDGGHARSQKRDADQAILDQWQHEWMDHYVKGTAPQPFVGVRAMTVTCPQTAPTEGPFEAATYAGLADGSVSYDDATTKPIVSGGDPQTGKTFDPGIGDKACATAPADDAPGTASYRLAAAPAGGWLVVGAPTIRAAITAPSSDAQIAARLLDVAPDGTEQLVARGLFRPDVSALPDTQTFQLHPVAWHFAAGHVPKLELLSFDAPYARPSNAEGPVVVQDLHLRLPTRSHT